MIYARGSTDNKGQILAHIIGVQEAIAADGDVPVNLIFVIEGEEEIGSPNLGAFLQGAPRRVEMRHTWPFPTAAWSARGSRRFPTACAGITGDGTDA